MGKITVVLPHKLDRKLRRFLVEKTGIYEHGSMTDFVIDAIVEKMDRPAEEKQKKEKA